MRERDRPHAPEPTTYYPGLPHADLKRQVDEGFDVVMASEIAEEWKTIGARLTEIAVDFRVILDGSRDGWRGRAGDGARTALAKVGEFSDKTGEHFTSTGDAMHAQTSAASEAKKRMPEPIEYDAKKMLGDAFRSGSVIHIMTVAASMPALRAKSDEAKGEAVQVMQSRDGALHAATTSMPAFAEMPTVTQDQGTVTSSSDTSPVTTSPTDPNTRIGASAVPTGTRDGTTHTSWAQPPSIGTPPTVTPPPTQPPPVTPPVGPPGLVPRPPIGTRPPNPPTRPVPPVRATPPGHKVPPGVGPGRGPAGGGPGGRFGGVAGGLPGGGPGGPSAPGGPGGAPGTGRGAGGFGPNPGFGPTGSPTGTNARSAAPGAMGGVGAGHGQGDEDQEHQAKFLIPSDEYFDDNRLVAPPTIGE
ncbi:PPE domain-containing protein [Actinosynnema sp. CA-248983]